MADIIGVDFWVIDESDMDMHPFTVCAGPSINSACTCLLLLVRRSILLDLDRNELFNVYA